MGKKIQKIKVSEIDNAIREEISKIKKAEKLRERLSEIDQTLAEAEQVEEVSVGGRKSGKEYYQKNTPIAKFEKKGSHLKEEEGDEEELETSIAGSFEEKFAEIGRELDSMLAGESEEMEDSEELEDLEDVDAEPEMDDLEIGDSDESEEEDDEMEVELEEDSMEEEAIEEEETLEEQDGETVANAAPQDKVNANMKKVDNKNPMADKLYEEETLEEVEIIDEENEEEVVAEEEVVNESSKKNKKVIKEQTDKKIFKDASPLLMEELDRMKKLARL